MKFNQFFFLLIAFSIFNVFSAHNGIDQTIKKYNGSNDYADIFTVNKAITADETFYLDINPICKWVMVNSNEYAVQVGGSEGIKNNKKIFQFSFKSKKNLKELTKVLITIAYQESVKPNLKKLATFNLTIIPKRCNPPKTLNVNSLKNITKLLTIKE